jgi:Uma2 family endonuclease
MSNTKTIAVISEEEYLQGEASSEIKYEYIDGYVYAMSGAKAAHNRIAGNIHAAFHAHLKGKSCQPYISDMKVKVGSKYFYPDVLVDCSNITDDSTFTESPTILVEVLSKSTRRMDETTKRVAYMQIETLQEYVLVEQDIVDIEVVRRSHGWLPEHYYLGDEITLASINLTISVEEIYDRIQNADIIEWLQAQVKTE